MGGRGVRERARARASEREREREQLVSIAREGQLAHVSAGTDAPAASLIARRAGVQGGRTIEVDVPEDASIRRLKRAIEDKEGIAQEGMTILTTAKQAWPAPLSAATIVCAGCCTAPRLAPLLRTFVLTRSSSRRHWTTRRS